MCEILEMGVRFIYVQAIGETVEERLEDCETILSLDNAGRVGLKIPMDIAGLEVVKQIREKYPRLVFCKILAVNVVQHSKIGKIIDKNCGFNHIRIVISCFF